MSNYGFPDWQDTLTQQAQPIVDVTGKAVGASDTYDTLLVPMHAALGVQFQVQGTLTGYQLDFNWFSDVAELKPIRSLRYLVAVGNELHDVFANPAPYLQVVVTPLAHGGGQQYGLQVVPYVRPVSRASLIGGDVVLQVVNQGVAAGATFTKSGSLIARARAVLNVFSTTTNWRAYVFALDAAAAGTFQVVSIDSAGTSRGLTQEFQMPGGGVSLNIVNFDVGAQVFHASIVLAG